MTKPRFQPALTALLLSAGFLALSACVSVHGPIKSTKAIEAGPIWDQNDANVKCPALAKKHHGVWTGQWTTTEWGKMSVCEIAPKPKG